MLLAGSGLSTDEARAEGLSSADADLTRSISDRTRACSTRMREADGAVEEVKELLPHHARENLYSAASARPPASRT